MSTSIRMLTMALLVLPCVFLFFAVVSGQSLAYAITLGLVALYAAVWLGARPSSFEVSGAGLTIIFPVWKRNVPFNDIAAATRVEPEGFRREFGFPLRIGVGGLWGGFGWLWTSGKGLVEMYVSRVDGLVLIERRLGRDILLTPENADDFVASATSDRKPGGARRPSA